MFGFYMMQVKANAVRALGNLSRFVQFTGQSCVGGDAKACGRLQKDGIREMTDSFQSLSSANIDWLVKMVQTFLSCVSTGNVKVWQDIRTYLQVLQVNDILTDSIIEFGTLLTGSMERLSCTEQFIFQQNTETRRNGLVRIVHSVRDLFSLFGNRGRGHSLFLPND